MKNTKKPRMNDPKAEFERRAKNKIVCAYCGKINEDQTFFIGAALKPSWTMIEGTGKMSCPDCYPKASAEGAEVLRRL